MISGRSKRAIRLFFIALLIAAAIWGALNIKQEIDIDTCLDRGGSWHYDISECSYTESYRGPR